VLTGNSEKSLKPNPNNANNELPSGWIMIGVVVMAIGLSVIILINRKKNKK
jgi:hypothetical protein